MRHFENKDSQGDEISAKLLFLRFGSWCKYIWSKRLIILCFGLIGGSLGLANSYFKKPIYTASTTFVLEGGEGGGAMLGQYAGLASMVGLDIGSGGGLFHGDNIIELFKSKSMIRKTLLSSITYDGKSQRLIEKYIDFNKLKRKWRGKPYLENISFDTQQKNFSRLQDSILEKVTEDIKDEYLLVSKPDKKLSVIKVSVQSVDEAFSKLFNNKIVQNVTDFYIQTKTKKSLQNVEILQQKTDSVQRVMNGAIYKAAAVADATPNLNPTRQIQRIAPVQRSQFSAETNKIILGELVKNLELSKINLVRETPLIQIIDEPIYPLHKDHLGKIKGIIIGGLLLGFLTIFFLSLRLLFKSIMSN